MKKFFLGAMCSILLIACNNEKKEETTATDATTPTVSSEKKGPVELLDSTYLAPIKASMAAFEKGDIDGYAAAYADDVRFTWSGGDSAIGKQALKDYYVGRWKMIETLKFSNQIYLPIVAHESPNGTTPAGKWMLFWYQVDVKYKNGKSIKFWAHHANHLNDAGKVDFGNQYIDRLPLMEATKGMTAK